MVFPSSTIALLVTFGLLRKAAGSVTRGHIIDCISSQSSRPRIPRADGSRQALMKEMTDALKSSALCFESCTLQAPVPSRLLPGAPSNAFERTLSSSPSPRRLAALGTRKYSFILLLIACFPLLSCFLQDVAYFIPHELTGAGEMGGRLHPVGDESPLRWLWLLYISLDTPTSRHAHVGKIPSRSSRLNLVCSVSVASSCQPFF